MSDGLAGVRVRDHLTGELKLDTEIRTGRVLDVITTTSGTGSVISAGLLEGELFFRVGLVSSVSAYPSTNFVRELKTLSVTASGQTLSWRFEWSKGGLPAGYSYQILYGVY